MQGKREADIFFWLQSYRDIGSFYTHDHGSQQPRGVERQLCGGSTWVAAALLGWPPSSPPPSLEWRCIPHRASAATEFQHLLLDAKPRAAPPLFPTFVVVVQLLSRVWLFTTPRTAACQACLFFIISLSLLKLTSIESVMPSNHFILCCPLVLLPSIFPSIRVFSNESSLCIMWPYTSFDAIPWAYHHFMSIPLISLTCP